MSVALITLSTSSCKKEIYGCKDETAMNYSPVANQDGEDCIYESDFEEEVITSTVLNPVWRLDGTSYRISLTWAKITQAILDDGAVDAHFRLSGKKGWRLLPLTYFMTASYSTTIEVAYYYGGVNIILTDSDKMTPDTPPDVDIKLVISK
tara:strand:- start:7 stop:456 length:450 start_codon:yes stop_codon:yes gene_type:complete